ncbi:MAG: DUF1501 domain-containing protein [Candidatus Sumerlaeia bacterium]|nr:DUF1501 domain-containing protein [Candidatus Sumerlaeia bacterium]
MGHAHDDHHCHSPEHDAGVSSRRTFLKRAIGAWLGMSLASPMLGLFDQGTGGGLSGLWTPAASAAEGAAPKAVRSVVLLWMDGGPSQLDTFDPKPGAPTAGQFRAMKTALPGALFTEHLERTASIADRLCVVRSMSTKEGNHSRAKHYLRTGYAPTGPVAFPGMGSMVASQLAAESSAKIPMNVSINAPGTGSGWLGVQYDPFHVQNAGRPVQNLALPKGVAEERFERRMALLAEQQERFAQRLGSAKSVRNLQEVNEAARAFMEAPEADAFDISQEPDTVRDAYGRNKFGEGCLMARRLVQRGVKFVEVSLGGWDTHEDNFTRVKENLGQLDPGLWSLVLDLETKGLLDTTLVVCMGEFGRTPRLNPREGRDHFPRAWSAVLAGGGVRPGVVGATSDDGSEVVSRKTSVEDLYRTIYTRLAISPDQVWDTPSGRPIKTVNGGEVIREVLG